MRQQLAIYGSGGFAKEVAWLVQSSDPDQELYDIVGFIDDDVSRQGRSLNELPVFSFTYCREQFPGIAIIPGIGDPQSRQKVTEKFLNAGFGSLQMIHPGVEYSRWVEMGPGALICAGNVLTTNIKLGKQVQINLNCTIGHDAILDDYATLAPGVHISGWVHLGKRVYVGTGAVIINGTRDAPIVLEDDVVVGAGAVVTKSVPAGLTVVGIPAKPLRSRG